LTRYTQDVTSMTGLTVHSDSGLVMDPEDRDRASEDLKAFKVRLFFFLRTKRRRAHAEDGYRTLYRH
jgi:hypothetical protein